VLVAGFVYIALAVGLLALWAAGFNPYCGYDFLLGRPLLLWGAAAYACMALACFGGVRKQYALAGAAALAAAHASFLTLAWQASGYLCPACAVFLGIEVALAGLLVLAPVKKQYPVLLSIAGAFSLVSVILLVYSPSVFGHVLPDGGVPEDVAVVADNRPVAVEGVSVSDDRVARKLPAVQSRLDGQAVARIREASPEVAPAPPAAAGGPAVAAPDKASSGEQEKEASPAAKASSGGQEKEVPLAAEKPLVAVMTVDGQQVQLDISRRPVLYFTWWCPACREVLAEVARLPAEKRPYLVAVCHTGIDVSRSVAELAGVGLSAADYYISRGDRNNAFPVFLQYAGGKAETVTGKKAVLEKLRKGEM
jgi:hypothetical protein